MICTKAIVLASFVVGSTRLALAACRGSVAGDSLQPRGHPVGGDAPDPHPLAAGGAAAHDLDVAGTDAEGVGEQAPYRNVGPAALGSLGDLDLERVPVPPGDTRPRRSRPDVERDHDGSVALYLVQLGGVVHAATSARRAPDRSPLDTLESTCFIWSHLSNEEPRHGPDRTEACLRVDRPVRRRRDTRPARASHPLHGVGRTGLAQ